MNKGRPKKGFADSKFKRVTARLGVKEARALSELTIATGKNDSEIVRDALRFYHYSLKKDHLLSDK